MALCPFIFKLNPKIKILGNFPSKLKKDLKFESDFWNSPLEKREISQKYKSSYFIPVLLIFYS